MKKDRHEIGRLAVETLGEVTELIIKGKNETQKFYELSTGWVGSALSEEDLKNKKIEAHVNSIMCLDKALIEIEFVIRMISDIR